MEQDDIGVLKSRIWITERCHMKSEKRNRFLEYYFHVTLAAYALASIAISLSRGESAETELGSVLTFTSVCTLSVSLLIFGFKFGEVAAQHRSCYLELQKIRIDGTDNISDLNIKYIKVLSYYPNHSTGDYMSIIVSNIFSSTQDAKDAKGDNVKISLHRRISYASYYLFIRLLLFIFSMAPVFIIYLCLKEMCAVHTTVSSAI